MTTQIALDAATIRQLDLSPVAEFIATATENPAANEQQLSFDISFPTDPSDPRELSEIPEIRLWFLRLDTAYPWLPFFLDWRQELARYTAMLVPHEFSRREGIRYNPEALEIFVTAKAFVLADWMSDRALPYTARLKAMAQLFGYDLDDAFFQLLDKSLKKPGS